MNAKQINQLRSFERMITSKVIDIYSAYLTTETKENLQKESLIKDDYKNSFTSPENIQGEIIRLVFSKVFEKILCSKVISFSDGQKKAIPYGKDIFNGLIIYFSKELSEKTNIKIDEVPNSSEYYNIILKLKEKLGFVFETMAFNCDALTIINASSLEEITKQCDKNAVRNYINEKNKNNTQTTEESKQTKKVFPLIYFDSKQYLKYIDENGKEQMIKIQNPLLVSKTYKELLKQNDAVSVDDILQAFSKIGETIPFYSKSIEPSSKLSSKEKDLLDTFYGKKEELFNNEKEEENLTSKRNIDNNVPQNLRLITEEEYEKLCMKSVNNKKLTDEELSLMEYFDTYYFGGDNQIINNANIKINQNTNQNQGLIKNPKTQPQGFAQKYMPLFALLLVIILGTIFGLIIFKTLR